MASRRAFLFGLLPSWPWWRRHERVRVGEAGFHIHSRGHSDRRYFWVHGNEATAKRVILAHRWQGRALLVDWDTRYLPFAGGRLDPNRMFSRDGAERNLRSLNAGWTPDELTVALNRLDRERDVLLKQLLPPPGGLVIAMHNNSAGYSVRDEIPQSDAVSLRQPDSPHEFILCTTWSDFTRLERSPFNVVLQHDAPPVDDGSLSRFCAARDIRYLNIEAGLASGQAQTGMLDWVERYLP